VCCPNLEDDLRCPDGHGLKLSLLALSVQGRSRPSESGDVALRFCPVSLVPCDQVPSPVRRSGQSVAAPYRVTERSGSESKNGGQVAGPEMTSGLLPVFWSTTYATQ
jgi:hypothetical protein